MTPPSDSNWFGKSVAYAGDENKNKRKTFLTSPCIQPGKTPIMTRIMVAPSKRDYHRKKIMSIVPGMMLPAMIYTLQ